MKQRKVYFDVMRIVAIFLVLMNHQPAYKLYYSCHGLGEMFALLEAVVIRINVPLFAMISGALLLGREETLRELWNKRVSRMLMVIPLFSLLLYLELGWLRNRDVSLHTFIYGLFAGNLRSLTSYWFLYAYLGFVLMLPFIRKVAHAISSAEFLWLMGIHVVLVTVIPLCGLVMRLFGMENLLIANCMAVPVSSVPLFFFPLIGYYLDRHIDVEEVTQRQWLYLALACMTGTAMSMAATYLEGCRLGFSQGYLDLFNYLNVIVAFLLIKRLFAGDFAETHTSASRVITFIGSLVFGIYLLDLAVQLPIYEQMKSALVPMIGSFWFSIAWCLTSFVLGGFVTFVLKHIPLLKRLL